MKPQLVHRYAWPIREAIEHLLGDDAGDCDAWRIRVEGDELVIDVVAPAYAGRTIEVPDNFDVDKLCDMIVAGEFKVPAEGAEQASETVAKIDTPAEPPAEPPRKGGALARQAGIICGEKGFWTFLAKKFGVDVTSTEGAAGWLKAQCGVESRIDFDHDEAKAANFREIDRTYRLWLEGYDV
ncbi:MAG: hypothetical protein EOR12_31890 [Mesorhizobium sp.]|uniref:hypothetical protein n=1 Tax=Mesorhizobium sp. TaxID=1871066 RepID=UPI000FE8B32F|nr:hypothetical protein [Mesorhizobium sp.]RWP82604.1 MAG: hypothetical protein EOR12_31890 [Mesorhizobium sp.]